MSDEQGGAEKRDLDYADVGLPTGKAFSQLAYPGDYAGALNPVSFDDDGTLLTLQPGPVHRRIALLAAVFLLSLVPASYRAVHARFEVPYVWLCVVILAAWYTYHRMRSRDHRPWLAVDLRERAIILPRARKKISFAHIIRLEVVSFAPVGLSRKTLSYRGDPRSGELRVVFNDRGVEQTWCALAWPDAIVLQRFVRRFAEATGIPVSRAMPLQSGEWYVTPFLYDMSH